MIDLPPKPFGGDWLVWANRLIPYLTNARDKLRFKRGDENAAEDGILLWDEGNKEPVISIDGVYRPLVIQDGSGMAYSNTDITAAATNTAYPITLDGIVNATGVSLGLPASRVVFEEGGTYLLSFSVQITSTNSSLKNLWFWPRINGSDVAGSTIKVSITDNGATIVMSRSALFDIAAGQYLEIMWATSDVAVTLESAPATAFAPSTPSVILGVTRIHQ
jgi:hypothetical protein